MWGGEEDPERSGSEVWCKSLKLGVSDPESVVRNSWPLFGDLRLGSQVFSLTWAAPATGFERLCDQ